MSLTTSYQDGQKCTARYKTITRNPVTATLVTSCTSLRSRRYMSIYTHTHTHVRTYIYTHEYKLPTKIREYECQLVCVSVFVRRSRAQPENNRSYTTSNLERDTGYPKVSRGFPHSLHLNTRKLPQTGHGRFLPNLFQRLRPRLHWNQKRHNSLDRLQTRKQKSNTLLFMSTATLKPMRLECYLTRLSGVNKVSLFRADSMAR
jgi:hypothetical protein